MKFNNRKQPKLIKEENGIKYYETNEVTKRKSLETRKKMVEARKKQIPPRLGQSKKSNNFFDELNRDYLKKSSAQGKYSKIDSKHKKEIEEWMKKNKDKLKSVGVDEGILCEYDIQKILYTEIKLASISYGRELNEKIPEEDKEELIKTEEETYYDFDQLFSDSPEDDFNSQEENFFS